jgi:hypothetical protein
VTPAQQGHFQAALSTLRPKLVRKLAPTSSDWSLPKSLTLRWSIQLISDWGDKPLESCSGVELR